MITRTGTWLCVAALTASMFLGGCGDKEDGGSEGGEGGVTTGGTGGTATGGIRTGGTSTGGSTAGGATTGGSDMGGAAAGGTGGVGTGGTTGGAETGGMEAGGSATGGSATGGAAGAASGGAAGAETGGSGGAAGSGATGGTCDADLVVDENNCGSCGNACDATEYCVNGACVVCDNTVLFLGDSQSAPNQALAAAMTALGMAPTLISSGAQTYEGTPDAAEFGVVYLNPGDMGSEDMPQTGQDSIVAAHSAEATGLVFVEYSAYRAHEGNGDYFASLEPLMLIRWSASFGDTLTFTLQMADHPIWAAIPSSFVTAAPMYFTSGSIINGGTEAASIARPNFGPYPGLVVKDGAPRTVHIAQTWTSPQGIWVEDVNIIRMNVNAAIWAAGCY